MGTLIVGAIVFVIVGLIIFSMIKSKSNGNYSCGCKKCSCDGSCHCCGK